MVTSSEQVRAKNIEVAIGLENASALQLTVQARV